MSTTTYTNCDCPKVAAILSSRYARSGRALHHSGSGGVVILIESKKSRDWSVLLGLRDGSPWRLARFNSGSMSSYHEPAFGSGVAGNLAEPEMLKTGMTTETMRLAKQQKKWADVRVIRSKLEGGSPVSPESPVSELPEPPSVFEGYTPRAKKVASGDDVFHPPAPNPDRYWYEAEKDAKLLKDFVALRLAGHTTNLMIVGPSGFGKTQGIIRFGINEGVPVHVVNCQAITTPEKWIGQMQVHPDRGTYFDVSAHIEWVERTHDDCKAAPYCIILYDEITRLRPELANMQFSLLDDQQGLEVPQMGRRVAMSDKNVVIATANIGTPYTGAFAMDWALRGRFDVNLERVFPPAEEEEKVLITATVPTSISGEDAKALIRVAAHTRTMWQNGELESPISTRSLVAWTRLVAGGYTVKDAAEYTIFPLYSEDGGIESDRAKVKQAVDGKVGS